MLITLVALAVPAAHAACSITNVHPVNYAVVSSKPTFTFMISPDCGLPMLVSGGLSKTPTFLGMAAGSRRMSVSISDLEWAQMTPTANTTAHWGITATFGGTTVARASTLELDLDGDTWTRSEGDSGSCDNSIAAYPGAVEICDGLDNNCDGGVDAGACTLAYGGHRIDRDGTYYYGLYSDRGFGVMGTSQWYGSSDSAGGPEGVTWDESGSFLYYNDLSGNVFRQSPPFGARSELVGTLGAGQVGGGVEANGVYYMGDYTNGDIFAMNIGTGATSLYASLGSTACLPYFGNSSMAIDTDGTIYAASSCGIVAYAPGGDAWMVNTYTGLITAVAMDAAQELYSFDHSGKIVHFDKHTGAVLGSLATGFSPWCTWTIAVDGNGDFVINDWGDIYLYSHVDGHLMRTWDPSTYYPGTTGYYWYPTF